MNRKELQAQYDLYCKEYKEEHGVDTVKTYEGWLEDEVIEYKELADKGADFSMDIIEKNKELEEALEKASPYVVNHKIVIELE